MRLALFLIAILTGVGSTVSAMAQSSGSRASSPTAGGHNIPMMVQGEGLKPEGSFYSGGYRTSSHGIPYVVHLYEHRRGSEAEIPTWTPWVLRLTGWDGDQQIQWANGQSCPAVYGLHQMLADLSAPRFRQPRFNGPLPSGARTLPTPPIRLDGGATVAVWGYATQSDGGMSAMMITGREGLIQNWVQFATGQLDPCWTDEAPDFPD